MKLFCRSAFVLWVSMNIMILVVPRYGAYLMALTGLMMLFSDALFWKLIPKRPLMIHIEVSEELGERFTIATFGVLRGIKLHGRTDASHMIRRHGHNELDIDNKYVGPPSPQ